MEDRYAEASTPRKPILAVAKSEEEPEMEEERYIFLNERGASIVSIATPPSNVQYYYIHVQCCCIQCIE